METVFFVNGMLCVHCKARVESLCKGIAGVTDAVADLERKLVTVQGTGDAAAIRQAIRDAGYEVSEE